MRIQSDGSTSNPPNSFQATDSYASVELFRLSASSPVLLDYLTILRNQGLPRSHMSKELAQEGKNRYLRSEDALLASVPINVLC